MIDPARRITVLRAINHSSVVKMEEERVAIVGG